LDGCGLREEFDDDAGGIDEAGSGGKPALFVLADCLGPVFVAEEAGPPSDVV
jgi:hypothetical protein